MPKHYAKSGIRLPVFLPLLALLLSALPPVFSQESEDAPDPGTEIIIDEEIIVTDEDELETILKEMLGEMLDKEEDADDEMAASDEDEDEETGDSGEMALQQTPGKPGPGSSLVNNEYYLWSVRLTEQAQFAYEEGDYDASASFSAQAAEYARLSDQYVMMRLAENTFAKAHSRYTWAGSVNAAKRYPDEYAEAGDHYNQALDARKVEDWETVQTGSETVLELLAGVQGAGGERGPSGSSQGTLPAQYTVRRWHNSGDCFSAIAGWSWVYGDPYQWRVLYEANKSKIPDPDNPHLILPGTVLDIPSLKGETRKGMWDPGSR